VQKKSAVPYLAFVSEPGADPPTTEREKKEKKKGERQGGGQGSSPSTETLRTGILPSRTTYAKRKRGKKKRKRRIPAVRRALSLLGALPPGRGKGEGKKKEEKAGEGGRWPGALFLVDEE